MSITDNFVLALYPPIIFFSAWSIWLYAVHVLLPAYRAGKLSTKDHALVLALVFTGFAHLAENIFYGYARLDPEGYSSLTRILGIIGPMKVLILLGMVFAVAGYKKAVNGELGLRMISAIAVFIWVASVTVIYFLGPI